MAASTSSIKVDKHDFIPINQGISFDYLYKWFTIHLTDEETLTELSSDRCHYKTHPIEKYPCRVFLVEYESCKRIRVWLNEQEVQIDKCSDYMCDNYQPDRMKSCWVCKWIDWNDKWLIDTEEIIDETTIDKPDFCRLHGDRQTKFGDGGEAFLVYPVWIHEHLPVKQSCRERLLRVFYTLNEERKDFHPAPSPVEDIIDPDLLPYRPPSTFDRNKWIERRKRQIGNPDDYKQNRFKRDLAQGAYNDLSEHEQLRDTYQWLPSEFIIDKDGKVDIRTPINHLPVLPEYRQSYGDIAKIFHAMLPMFEQMKLINLNSNQEQKLQVIVKAQSYNLKTGMKYSGRWHTEGQTENIVAVGVYYLDVDDQLEGGSLKFRPAYTSQSYDGIETDHYVSSVKTGAAVVFSNSIPHRFQQIRNLTHEDGRRRTFLNFFIVDPEQPIHIQPNEIIYAPKDFIIQIFQQWNQRGLPDIIIDHILKMLNLSSMWETQDYAKEFRARVRRSMLDEKSGWGWICWGNCGTTEFVRSLSTWSPRERDEARDILHHTESD